MAKSLSHPFLPLSRSRGSLDMSGVEIGFENNCRKRYYLDRYLDQTYRNFFLF